MAKKKQDQDQTQAAEQPQEQDQDQEQQTQVNTTESMKENPKPTFSQLDKEVKDAAKILGNEKKEEVEIPKFLTKRLGKNVPVGVNGAVIHVPVGEKVKIPKSMAKVLNDSIKELKL